jgi:hypothetical protein
MRSWLLLLASLLSFASCFRAAPRREAAVVRTVVLTPSTSDLPAGWSAEDFRGVIQRAVDLWSYPKIPCGIRVVVDDPRPEWRAVQDGTNLIAVRGHSWCHNGRCGATSTYPLRAMGMTTTYPVGATGRAVTEADIEINGVFFQLADPTHPADPTSPRRPVPLESVLIHEIGHVLGMADVCGETRTESGRPITSTCSAADRQRAMFASGLHDAPAPADVAALCAIYPPRS